MPPISYIAMNVTCDGIAYFIKWEADLGQFGLFEVDPKSVPGCYGIFSPAGLKMDGDDLGFSVSVDPGGLATVTLPQDQNPPEPECFVLAGVVKGGQLCNLITDFGVILPTGMPFTVGCPT